MATIQNLRLNVAEISEGFVFQSAFLSFDILFSPAEVRLGLDYYVHAVLYEQDGRQDKYTLYSNGMERSIRQLGDDDFIAYFPSQKINPNGQRSRRIQLSYNLAEETALSVKPKPNVRRAQTESFDQPPNLIEFFAIAQVHSELSPATAFSNKESANIITINF